jgi:hypothetical protein
MKEFKIRASACGKIMGNAKNDLTENQTAKINELTDRKNGNGKPLTLNMESELSSLIAKRDMPPHLCLPDTCTSYLQEWLKERLYKRKKEVSTKYMEKGLVMEDNSLDFIADYLGLGLLIKNEKHYSNDHFQGTPDVVLSDTVIDVKNSWDCFTFPLFENEVPDKDYYWQGQVYMALTGKEKYKLIYTLMDTPEHLIEKEFKWNNFYQLDYDEFRGKYLYGDTPTDLRIKIFEFKRNDEDIEKIKSRVIGCRDYLKTIKS